MPHPVTCTRLLKFDAGHRVLGHEGKCKHIHGHEYRVEVTVAPKAGLDALGMVVDFSEIKNKLGYWIDGYLDHNFLCHPDDPLLKLIKLLPPDEWGALVGGRHPYVMPNEYANPTAENIACLLFKKAEELFITCRVVKVRVWETSNCHAECTGPWERN